MHSTLVRIGYTPQSAVNRQIKDGSRFDSLFPKHEGKKELLKKDGEVDDTIEFMKDIVQSYNFQTKKIADKLAIYNGSKLSEKETCERIWQFVVDYIKYNIEKGEQLRTPSQTWYDGQIMARQNQSNPQYSADCDCMAIFVGCILLNLGIPFTFRVTGYSDVLGICHGFQHVYVIAHCDTGDIIIDPVYHEFNKEKKYEIVRNYAMSLNGCDIYRLSGLGEVYYEDEMGNLSGKRKQKRKEKKAARKEAKKDKKAAKKAIKAARKSGDKEALAQAKAAKKEAKQKIQANRTGIAKAATKVGKGVAKAAKATAKFVKNTTMLVPRSMFMLLIRLNFRGMATKFANNPNAYSKFLKTWKKVFGGKEKKLKKSIERGKNRKALFGKKKGVGQLTLNEEYIAIAGYLQGLPVFDKIKTKMQRLFKRDRELNGCDCISNEIGRIDGLGFAATAAVSSAVASATPIIKKAVDIFSQINDMIPESVKDAISQKFEVEEVDEDEAINYESEDYEDEDDIEEDE